MPLPDAEARRRALVWGAEAEAIVASALEQDGWLVLARNWRGAGGELDVVVRRDRALRFVEVKARPVGSLDDLESVTPVKQARLSRAAEAFLLACPQDADDLAFLVALVHETGDGPVIEWVDDAFDGVG